MVLAFIVSLPMLGAPTLPASADGDHDRARDLYDHGDIRGLGDVLRRAAAEAPGDVVGVDLVQSDGVWVYRLSILGEDGHRRIIEMNANQAGDDEPHRGNAQ
jgi:uncharacterized membrane protein YkoI